MLIVKRNIILFVGKGDQGGGEMIPNEISFDQGGQLKRKREVDSSFFESVQDENES